MGKKPVNAIPGKQGFQKTGRSEVGKAAPTAATSLPAGAADPEPNNLASHGEAYEKLKDATRNGLQEQIRGKTIAVREMNGYHDSDFRALVQGQNGGFGWVTTGSTAVGGGFVATPDATDEVRDAYREWWNREKSRVDQAQADLEDRLVTEGKTVLVDGGRKHRGKVGTVVWHGPDQFRSNHHGTHYRARIRTDEGEEFYVPEDYLHTKTRDGAWAPAEGTATVHQSPLPRGVSANAFVFSEFPHPDSL